MKFKDNLIYFPLILIMFTPFFGSLMAFNSNNSSYDQKMPQFSHALISTTQSMEGDFLIDETLVNDGLVVEISAILHMIVSPNDLSSNVQIYLTCTGWWEDNVNSSKNLNYYLRQPDGTEIESGQILFNAISFTLNFTPETTGDWQLELTFSEIVPVFPANNAELTFDGNLQVEGLTSGIWFECKNSSSYNAIPSSELYLRNMVDQVSFWLLLQEPGTYALNLNMFAPLGNQAPIEKILFSRYNNEGQIEHSFSTVDHEGEMAYPFEISENQLGIWKVTLVYRTGQEGYCLAIRLLDPSSHNVHFYIPPEDGKPPVFDEKWDGTKHILIEDFDIKVPVSVNDCAVICQIDTEIVKQGSASNKLSYVFEKSNSEWIAFEWFFQTEPLNFTDLNLLSLWLYGSGDSIILFCYLSNELMSSGDLRSIRWDTKFSHTGWKFFELKKEDFVLDNIDYFNYSDIQVIRLGIGYSPSAPCVDSVNFDHFQADIGKLSTYEETTAKQEQPTLNMTPGLEIATITSVLLVIAILQRNKAKKK